MIVVTGAAGFIGSCLIGKLNEHQQENLILTDDFSPTSKKNNFFNKKYALKIHRDEFLIWFDENHKQVDFVFHLGARTDTTEFDRAIFDRLNVEYSKSIWKICTRHSIPLIYASSAATYGLGELGYKDSHLTIPDLKPLNPYGDSKNDFDKWVICQDKTPPFWAGLKFFNVYGPNEYHKGRMASVIYHAFNQIKKDGEMKLFRSHDSEYKDGEQLRDFIYVKDVVQVCEFLRKKQPESGIYNLGTGRARTFIDLVSATFNAMEMPIKISFIDTPLDIRDKYQYFTEADMKKLRQAGYQDEFQSLESGVEEYVKQYLLLGNYY